LICINAAGENFPANLTLFICEQLKNAAIINEGRGGVFPQRSLGLVVVLA